MKSVLDEATPRPWSVNVETEGDEYLEISIPEIGRCLHGWEWAEGDDAKRDLANADLIVEAVNNHDRLVAENAELKSACEAALKWMDEEAFAATVVEGRRRARVADRLRSVLKLNA